MLENKKITEHIFVCEKQKERKEEQDRRKRKRKKKSREKKKGGKEKEKMPQRRGSHGTGRKIDFFLKKKKCEEKS